MSRRLNDTAALTAAPCCGESHSVNVRKIENGFLVDTSSCNDRTGEYKHSTQFYEKAPRIMAPKVARSGDPSPDQGNALRAAKQYMNGDV